MQVNITDLDCKKAVTRAAEAEAAVVLMTGKLDRYINIDASSAAVTRRKFLPREICRADGQ